MGGDVPPTELFQALLFAAQELPSSVILTALVTPEVAEQIEQRYIPFGHPSYTAQVELVTAQESISMEDDPLWALRRKRASTMHLAFELLKLQKLHALISVANTGALVAGAALFLPLLPGVSRPALLASLPTEARPVALLDVGGNLATRPEHLLQFAHIGASFQMAIALEHSPLKIGLLNIGKETGKGGEHRRSTFSLLEQNLSSPLQFIGNVEPHEVFRGLVDVVVTDGFSGNIFLKAAEGAASCIFRQVFHSLASFEKRFPQPLEELHDRFNSVESPGALLCGVERLVIKCHGCSTPRSLLNGIRRAYCALQENLIYKIKEHLQLKQA